MSCSACGLYRAEPNKPQRAHFAVVRPVSVMARGAIYHQLFDKAVRDALRTEERTRVAEEESIDERDPVVRAVKYRRRGQRLCECQHDRLVEPLGSLRRRGRAHQECEGEKVPTEEVEPFPDV
jgi:hypothetical protein